MTYRDARIDLEILPEANLYDIARNPAAVHRGLAMRLLVERGSLFAGHPDIAEECRELVLQDPIVLKKVDPAQALHALQLPGVIDILADLQTRRQALTCTVAEHNATHTKNIASLEDTVTTNKAASEQALHDASVTLWSYFLKQTWQLAEDAAAQKIEHDKLRADHDAEIADAKARLALLERPLRQKVSDWLRARWARLRKPKADPALVAQEDENAFESRVAEMVRRA